MTGGYDAVDDDPYVDPETGVLKNLLDIRDAKLLDDFEVEMTSLRAREPFPAGRFSPTHYCRVHHHLFQDVYAWAGKYRTVRTAKGGNWFCYPENIDREMRRLFAGLKKSAYLRGRDFPGFIAGAADFLGDLNALHPFREGNGRAQLSFMHLLAEHAGHPLRFERVRKDAFLAAMIASFGGNPVPLITELSALKS